MEKIKLIVTGVMLLLLSALSSADIIVDAYKVDGYSNNNLEVGATFNVTVKYKNSTGSDQNIVGALFYFNYDTTLLDAINETAISDNLASSLSSKTNQTFTPSAGKITYQRDAAGGAGLSIQAGATIPCFTLTFHLKQSDANAGDKTILSWLQPLVDYAKLTIAGGDNVIGTVPLFQNAALRASAKPTFGGINTLTDTKTGNILSLDWAANAGTASDITQGAATYYSSGNPLRYNVYKGDSVNTLIKQEGPIDKINTSYSNLDDNSLYFFKIKAQDACTSTPNEGDNAVILSAIPHDYKAPTITGITADPDDQKLTLSWTAPDADTQGYLVLRKENVDPQNLPTPPTLVGASGDNNGTDYSKETDIQGWKVIKYITSKNETFFVDGQDPLPALDNNKKYYYAVYAFDPVGGNPVQQGRNYTIPDPSKTAKLAQPGKAPSALQNFIALSSPEAGNITFRCDTPQENYSIGAKVVYTTDKSKWSTLTPTSALAADFKFDLTPSSKTIQITKITQVTDDKDNAKQVNLDLNSVYYFKAFPYNNSGMIDPNAGVLAAALPLVATGTAASEKPNVSDLELKPDQKDPTKMTLSWKISQGNDTEEKDKTKKVDIYSSASPDSGYQSSATEVSSANPQSLVAAGTTYYRIVPSGKKPVGFTAANAPAGTTPSETVGRVVYTLKPGINTFSYPFPDAPIGINGKQISTAQDLIDDLIAEIKSQGKDATTQVTVFGYWDNKANKAIGFALNYTDGKLTSVTAGPNNGVYSDLSSFELNPNTPYQISIGKAIPTKTAESFDWHLLGKL